MNFVHSILEPLRGVSTRLTFASRWTTKFLKAEGSQSAAKFVCYLEFWSRAFSRITTSRDGGRSSVPSKTLVHWTLSVDQRSSLSKAGCKRQFSLTGVKGGYLMGARHHSANERNGKWTMRRAYSDENRHCAMWLTCKGMPVQHEAGISIQMFPRTWISYDPTVWIYAKVYKILGRGGALP